MLSPVGIGLRPCLGAKRRLGSCEGEMGAEGSGRRLHLAEGERVNQPRRRLTLKMGN